MNQFDIVYAEFQPKRRDDLREGVADVIGRRMLFRASWIIEDGQFEGQWAMATVEAIPEFAWVPECDIHIISKEDAE